MANLAAFAAHRCALQISGSDADMDFEIDNIIFRAKDVLPTNIHLENRAMLDVSTSETKAPSLWDSALLIRMYVRCASSIGLTDFDC